jgi:two-component system, NarL family, response regulator YdfI
VVPAPSSAPRAEMRAVEPVEALIIDRQPLFLAALASLLEAPPLSAHVITASRTDTGLDIARTQTLALIFCELRAEPLSGVELVQVLATESLDVPVVLLGDDGDESQLAAALAMNVAGAFSKNSALEEFLAGVRAVVSGHRAIGSGLLVRLLERPGPPYAPESQHIANRLSPTELAILAMIGQAQSIPAIAANRGISHKTVRNHLAKIYRKLELHGRTEAMLWATRMGLTGS